MKKTNIENGEWQKGEGYYKRVFFDPTDMKQDGVQLQQIKISPNQIAENHYHENQTEVFYFLNNHGYFVVNGEKVIIKTGDILMIEPRDEHKVVNNSEKDFLYLAFKSNYSNDDIYWV